MGVEQLHTDLGNRPVSSKATVADPTEDIPTNDPPGQSDPGLGLGTLGSTVPGTAWVGTAVEFANQLKRTAQSEDAAIAVIANMHHPSAAETVTVNNVQLPK